MFGGKTASASHRARVNLECGKEGGLGSELNGAKGPVTERIPAQTMTATSSNNAKVELKEVRANSLISPDRVGSADPVQENRRKTNYQLKSYQERGGGVHLVHPQVPNN